MVLSFILDAAIHGDLLGVREHAALMAVDLEQVAHDQGRLGLGFPTDVVGGSPARCGLSEMLDWLRRAAPRAFAALCPQRWATIALAYSK